MGNKDSKKKLDQATLHLELDQDVLNAGDTI
jgi:hypothetical protein